MAVVAEAKIGGRPPLRIRTRVRHREHLVDIDVRDVDPSALRLEVKGHVVRLEGPGFRRSFRLPDAVDATALSATYYEGVLRLRAPCARLTSKVVPIVNLTSWVHPDVSPI